MKRQILILWLSICLALGSFGIGWSDDFQKGLDAAQRGDYTTALKEWTSLAEQGDAKARFNLGIMYERGQGVLQDYKTAVKWYALSAEQGDALAQYNLGVMYEKGRGVPQDHKAAFKWYTLSAEQGYAKAQYNLGVTYALGQGVIEDKVYANMWGNILNSNGHEDGKKIMDYLLKQGMTPSQIEEAERLAKECIKKNYKGC